MMIKQAQDEWDSTLDFPLPLIRLRVEYTGYDTFLPQRFGKLFVDQVANPKNILHMYRFRTSAARRIPQTVEPVSSMPVALHVDLIQHFVNGFLESENLKVVDGKDLFESAIAYVEKSVSGVMEE